MSRFTNLIPLLALLLVLSGAAYVGYQIYLWSTQLSERGKKSLEKKDITFTKDGGLKVGVKEMKGETYEDKTQNVLVNVWTTSSESRHTASRTNSSQSTVRPGASHNPSTQSVSGARPSPSLTPSTRSVAQPASRDDAVPGGWS